MGQAMNDLAMTIACAEAMGIKHLGETGEAPGQGRLILPGLFGGYYAPLYDDAQAMAMVRRFKLCLHWNSLKDIGKEWWAVNPWGNHFDIANNADLNRAICECVAKMIANNTDLNRAICECVAKMQEATKKMNR
jgi:hypothetical protein